ncbi:MAG: hydroxymethylbilane synthase [Verrucomicrobia bacterium]|nr:hydroxymethylbilane synthase [Verrucomicrobiota bacterium]MCH8512905.1 hydroxymethylbilane synthase [Kiritimatiellia bacterium]
MNDTPTIRVLARSSPLSRIQSQEAIEQLRPVFPTHDFALEYLTSIGDKDQNTPLTDPNVPTDFFTRELDAAQLEGRADLVIHSAKDLPDPLPEGLVIAALLPGRDPRDALVVRDGVNLQDGGIVGTSSPVREAAIRTLYPDISCKSIRGSIGRRLEQLDAGQYDAVIIAGCALQRLGLEDRITEWLDYETTPQQGRLAITVRKDRADLLEPLRSVDVRRSAGLVALVGCPADARLLGGQALSLLEAADIILHDRLVPEQVLATLGSRAEYVGKKGHSHSTTQAHIHRRLLAEAEKGHLVVRLHGGDPGVLGHLGETLDFCRAWNLRTEVVPAVSAAQLTAARAQCTLTHRYEGRSISFLSGHKGLADHPLPALSPEHGHLAIYMGVRDIAAIRERLLEAGWPPDTSVTAGMDLGNSNERHIHGTLDGIHEQPLAAPAVLLIGPTPHTVPTTLFTGTDPEKFLRHGPLLHFPMIELTPVDLGTRRTALKKGLREWDGIIFPSGFAVNLVIDTLMELGDTRLLIGKKLLAVGPLTAKALENRGLKADAVPEGFGGAAALADLAGDWRGVYGYPTSDQSPIRDRQAALTDKGIQLDATVFYHNTPTAPEHLPLLPFARVIFTAGSAVRAYFDRFPEELQADREWLAVGTSTLMALRKAGIQSGTIL